MKMQIAVATDFKSSTGCPGPRLKAIAEAGFTHLHWCHQWNTDFLYDDAELAQIRRWLEEYGLTLLDIHGSAGQEKCWYSLVEYERQAGVALVANRLKMHHELGGTGTVMMHIPFLRRNTPADAVPVVWQQVSALKKSIQELLPMMSRYHIPLALENTPGENYEILDNVLASFPPELVGLCYDSGHGNIHAPEWGDARGLDFLETKKDRIEALHLHDNNGLGDQHQPPFMGNVDWERLTGILAASKYRRPVSFELSMGNTPFTDIPSFLADAYQRCRRVAEMVEAKRA